MSVFARVAHIVMMFRDSKLYSLKATIKINTYEYKTTVTINKPTPLPISPNYEQFTSNLI